MVWQHLFGAEEWWAGSEQGIGVTGQVPNSRGPEGMAAAGGAYDDLGVELRTAGCTPALPHAALLAAGTA
ncbi:hypothetical protein [Streptomyces microflavus]|uniref:hypothetical protein n=1 Tax=Streptomyces microflavus TaxID=1919 RepID=UPI0033C85E95